MANNGSFETAKKYGLDAIKFHDQRAATWSAAYQRSNHFRRRERQWKSIIDGIVEPDMAVLDIGCGSGDLSILAASRGATLTCADGSSEMLAAARNNLTGNGFDARMVEADVRDLPFKVGEFQFVIASSLLEYVTPLDCALNEIHRILRPDGLLACSVPNPRSFYRWGEGLTFFLAGRPQYRRVVNPLIYKHDFRSLLAATGFDVLVSQPSGTPPLLDGSTIGNFVERNTRLATMMLYLAKAR